MSLSPVSTSVLPSLTSANAGGAGADAVRPVATTDAATEGQDALTLQAASQAIKQANDSFQQKGQNLYATFEKDKATGISVVKIVDKKTNETISQLPVKEMVAFANFLEHPHGGLLHTTA